MLARWCCEKGGALKKWWHARFLYAAQGAIVWSGRTRHSLATGCMSDVNIYTKFSFVGAGFCCFIRRDNGEEYTDSV